MDKLLTSKQQLIDYIINGAKSKDNQTIGIEFENFLFNLPNYSALSYEDIKNILTNFSKEKWQEEIENNNIIGLKGALGSISLEPAGQLELSSKPVANINEIATIINKYFEELLPILKQQNIALVSMGYNPKFHEEDLPLMPKDRVHFMYNYMPKVGTLGRFMMKNTGTYQVNLDYNNEEDLIKKFRVLMALQPILVGLFANSAIILGENSGYLSYRNHVWNHTDKARSGLLPCAFSDSFNIESYVDYALNTPMYFIKRDNKYIDAQQILFKNYLSGQQKISNYTPTIDDFELHLSTLFPDVRIKTYLETRATDCPDVQYYNSLPALLVGLTYDDNALNCVYDLIKNFNYEQLQDLKLNAITNGFNAKIQNKTISALALEILNIAKAGLKSRNLQEEIYLYNLENLIVGKKTMAEQKIELFQQSGNLQGFLNKITTTTYNS